MQSVVAVVVCVKVLQLLLLMMLMVLMLFEMQDLKRRLKAAAERIGDDAERTEFVVEVAVEQVDEDDEESDGERSSRNV